MDKFDGITPGITDQRVLTVGEEHTVSPAGTSGLSASFHKYGDVCGECDGVEFAKRRRHDVLCIGEEERQRNRRRPAATLRADGGCG